MFNLVIDNKTATISPSTKIRLEIKSTLSDPDALRGKIVYPIDLPFNKENNEVFSNAHVIHVIYEYKVYTAQLSFYGKTIISGELVLLGTNGNGYHVTIIDKGMSSSFIEQSMDEMDIPAVKMVDKPHLQLAGYMTDVVRGMVSTDFELPMVYAPDFYEGNTDFGGEDNTVSIDPDDNGARGKYQNRWNADRFSWNRPSIDNPVNVYTFVPYPKLYNTISKIFSLNGISIFGSFLDKTKKEKLIITNSRTLDENFFSLIKCRARKKYSQTLMRFSDGNPYGGYHLDFSAIQDYPNNYDYNGVPWTGGWMGGSWHAYLVPQVPDFPNLICEYSFAFTLFIHANYCSPESSLSIEVWWYPPGFSNSYFLKRTDFAPSSGYNIDYTLVYEDTFELAPGTQIYFVLKHSGLGATVIGGHPVGDMPIGVINASQDSYIEITNMTIENYNAGSKYFKLNHHLPNISLGEFINILRRIFGVVIYSDHNTREMEMSTLSDLYNSNGYVDLSNYVIPASLEKTFNEVTANSFVYAHEVETPENAKWPAVQVLNFHDLPKGSAGDKISVIADGMVYQYGLIEAEDRYGWVPVYPLSRSVDESVKEKNNMDCLILSNTERMKKLFPITNGKAISDKFGSEGENTFGLLYYMGLSADRNSNNPIWYPFATAFNHDVNGNALSNTPLFESGKGSNGEVNTLPYLDASNKYEQTKCRFKIPLNLMDQLFFLLKPQRGIPTNAVRKVMLNSVKFTPLVISCIVDPASKDIETEITMIKDGR